MQNQELFQKTVDFIEGRYPAREYIYEMYEKGELYAWVQSLVPADRTRYQLVVWIAEDGFLESKTLTVPYDILEDIKDLENPWHGGLKKESVLFAVYTHEKILEVFKSAFPKCEIKPSGEYKEKEMLMIECPDYIDGTEVYDQGVLDKIIDSLPKDLSMSKKKTLFRKLVREAFHVEGNKYPRWIQSPEWPVNNGVPLKFVKTKRINSEMVHHYFVDINTGEERIVEDSH